MVHSAALMIQGGMTLRDVAKTVFPHPSVSEVIREAVLSILEKEEHS